MTTHWGPWRFIAWFGVTSLLADVVYEGARSITGPYLASLGLGAAAIGAITGAGEAVALAGRVVSGPIADRTRAYWPLVFGGYAMTVLTVPLMGLVSVTWVVAALILAERAGKAVRRPAKDVMLSHASSSIGRGRGFAVHEALDQFGGVIGPLLVAGTFAATQDYAPTFAVLAIPGVLVAAALVVMRMRVPDAAVYEPGEAAHAPAPSAAAPSAPAPSGAAPRGRLGSALWWYAAFAGTAALGFTTFGVIAYHLLESGLVSAGAVPLVYAGAMIVDALAALAVGGLYDRVGRRVLLAVPILGAAVAPLVFSTTLAPVLCGVALWAVVLGLQESVMRAEVAALAPPGRRGTAYGAFAAVTGVAAFVGGALTGALYEASLTLLVWVIVGLQVAALGLAAAGFRRRAAGVA